ncbi:putative integral membrane protein [Halobacteriovorax marinus SJ]|uniref:Protoporphyrinogen IX oxidase n=1 Tax=Halobacteriovorax marinus (strain ATCC BAA-682 / DSM 15412 / SJ) TaxID=862908 RepID=E1X416_HALMS|nr:CopD family protein [Halobacteriovorax marinus]CBW25356.1 putative integral membrane protein [Halobacteriovorax marinus SJ]
MEAFPYLKALHIIFIVTWFAGLFYIVRLFIYQTEAQEKEESERAILTNQFKIMSKRLWYGITWPSAILTLIFGPSLIHVYFPITDHPWLLAKLAFVLLLYIYHFICQRIFKELQNDQYKWSSNKLRVWNEVATLLLFAIVFLVILQSIMSMWKGLAGLVLLSILLMIGIKAYRKQRLK